MHRCCDDYESIQEVGQRSELTVSFQLSDIKYVVYSNVHNSHIHVLIQNAIGTVATALNCNPPCFRLDEAYLLNSYTIYN